MRRTFLILYACFAAFLAAIPLSAPAAAEAASPGRTLTVSGEGEVKAVPDQAVLTAGVESQAATAAKALAANRKAMNDVFAELKRQGIPDKSIQTSQFTVSPQYDSPRHGAARIVSYQVTNSVTVTIDDTAKVGEAIDALVASGANSTGGMGGISFAIRDPKPLMKQAREAAIKDAMDRAQTYARAAGVKLGPVIAIDENGIQVPRPQFRAMAAGMMANEMATPIAAGQQSVTANVTVRFEIQ